MDAYLEEELIDLFTFYLQNSTPDELESKKQRVIKIGKELYQDGGVDAMENMFYSVEIRIKEELVKTSAGIAHGGMEFQKDGRTNQLQ